MLAWLWPYLSGELPNRQEVPDAVLNGGLQLPQVPLTQDERHGLGGARRGIPEGRRSRQRGDVGSLLHRHLGVGARARAGVEDAAAGPAPAATAAITIAPDAVPANRRGRTKRIMSRAVPFSHLPPLSAVGAADARSPGIGGIFCAPAGGSTVNISHARLRGADSPPARPDRYHLAMRHPIPRHSRTQRRQRSITPALGHVCGRAL